MILVDDQLLVTRLRDPRSLRSMATTCCWWWRLASAVAGGREGALSRRLQHTGVPRATVNELPEVMTVLDLRELVPMMSVLASAFRLNLLAAEALAAAETLGADIVVGQDTPRLREAARVRGITYLVEA